MCVFDSLLLIERISISLLPILFVFVQVLNSATKNIQYVDLDFDKVTYKWVRILILISTM